MKDKEWAQKEIDRYLSYEGVNEARNALVFAKGVIDQLDEPEVLSQEWIRNNQERKGVHFFVKVTKLQNLLVPKQEITFDQVHGKLREESILSEKSFDYYWNCINDNVEIDEPGNLIVPKKELPVIPKYVADWIVSHREKFDLYPALKKLEGNPFGWERTYEWYRVNTHEFVSVYLTGEYEVEKEQKYYVIDKEDNILLIRGYGGIEKADNLKITNSGGGALKLTEQEIKDFDPRYWAFRKPV